MQPKKFSITYSRSGHYTVTARISKGERRIARRISSLETARAILAAWKAGRFGEIIHGYQA